MKFQKFHLNRIKYLILILLFITFIPSVSAIVKPTSNFYVNDYANILSEETERYILNRSVALNNVDGTQIVVVTVKNLEGMSLESYSLEVARSFGIGSKEKNNGLLILLALEERELRTEVGTGLEGIIPDGKSGRIQDQYMVPYLKNNNWDEGIKNGYDAYYKEIVTLNKLNVDYSEPVNTNLNNDTESIELYFGLFLGIFVGVVIRNLKIKRDFFTVVYLIISLILLGNTNFNVFAVFNFIGFIMGRFGIIYGGFSSGSSGGFSSGYSSGGSSFGGGGGSFRGGGSSRRF